MNQGKVRFEWRQERIFSASNFVFFFFSHSEPDSTERELSERHGGIAGGEALHSSLHPFPRRRRPNMSEFGANYQRLYLTYHCSINPQYNSLYTPSLRGGKLFLKHSFRKTWEQMTHWI